MLQYVMMQSNAFSCLEGSKQPLTKAKLLGCGFLLAAGQLATAKASQLNDLNVPEVVKIEVIKNLNLLSVQ